MMKFYGHFAAAYGTCWLVVLVVAFLTGSHIETGLFGLVGFPLGALAYAAFRVTASERDESSGAGRRHSAGDLADLRRRVRELEAEASRRRGASPDG